jgi:hypothetical protein
MNLVIWIEESALAEWVRYSIWGYPLMITLHSLGLAIMVGLSTVLSLRVLGFFNRIPYGALRRLFSIAWIGFLVNVLSGGSLFANSATTFIVDWLFLLKMTMVIAAAILVGIMQSLLRSMPAEQLGASVLAAPANLKLVAWLTMGAWSIGMVAGRFIAYPH